jgi:hypothetical protein
VAYLGNQPILGNWRKLDDISGSFNGSTTAFTTSVDGENVTAATVNQLFISLGGVIQEPGVDFTVTTNTITFTTAPASGLSFFGIYAGDSLNLASVADGSIATSSLQDGSVTNAKVNASAGIVDTKLATISTAGKVSGTAITSGNISTTGSFATTSTVAVGQSSAAANTDLDVAGTYAGNVVAVGALDIDCSSGNYFTKTINANSTFTFSNVPASRSYGFTLELTHTSGTITWPAAVKWPKDTAPTLTTGTTHLFMFVTDDGGTRWRGSALVDYVN